MISVVTITYNNFEDLVKTVESLSHQYEGLQLIIVNGGTCQKSREYLDELQQKLPLAKIIQEPDKGIADAFNKGVKYCTGDGIVFLNSGDILIAKDYLQICDRLLQKNRHLSFIHGEVMFTDMLCGEMKMRPRLCSLGRGMPYYHQTMVVRKEVFDQIGPFKLSFKIAMDYEFVCRMEKMRCRGHYYNVHPVVRMDGMGISATKEEESIKECYIALRQNGLLNLKNICGLFVRLMFYKARVFMVWCNCHDILKKLKKLKNQ